MTGVEAIGAVGAGTGAVGAGSGAVGAVGAGTGPVGAGVGGTTGAGVGGTTGAGVGGTTGARVGGTTGAETGAVGAGTTGEGMLPSLHVMSQSPNITKLTLTPPEVLLSEVQSKVVAPIGKTRCSGGSSAEYR